MAKPLISVILPTKNALPQLKNSIEGLKRQTYKNFEVIIQDALSTDETLNYLESQKKYLKIDIVSKPDAGIGQAYGRGLKRTHGDLICFSAADECLFDHSLEMGVYWYKKSPNAAIYFGSSVLVDSNGHETFRCIPKIFNFFNVICCNHVPSISGLLNRRVIGKELYYDETLKTCPDYDFWLRLGSKFSSKQIKFNTAPFMKALSDSTSMSFRAEVHEQFSKDKFFILNRFIDQHKKNSQRKQLEQKAEEGILRWATKMVTLIEGICPAGRSLCKQAKTINLEFHTPQEPTKIIKDGMRLVNPKEKFFFNLKMHLKYPRYYLKPTPNYFIINQFLKKPFKIYKYITDSNYTQFIINRMKTFTANFIRKLDYYSKFISEKFESLGKIEFNEKGQLIINYEGRTEDYIVQWLFNKNAIRKKTGRFWVKVELKVVSGSIELLITNKNTITNGMNLWESDQKRVIYYQVTDFANSSVVIRNGGTYEFVVHVYDISLIQSTKE